jgi:tetratricopeptide (TPR) repeat protein
MKRILIGILLGLLFCSTIPVWATADEIAKADELWKSRRSEAIVRQAIVMLENLVAKEPQNYDALWRLARFYQHTGDFSESKNKLTYYEKGLNYAKEAVKANEHDPDGHLWLAVLMGRTAEEKGILNSLAMVTPIYNEIQAVLSVDPKNARAHNVLAQVYWKAPGKPLSMGDKKKALVEAKLAVEYEPSRIYYWVIYGQVAKSNKNFEIARMALTKAIDIPIDQENPGDESDKRQAKSELEKLPKN